MTERSAAIARGEARELVWLLEHPALYTAGTSSQPHELIDARFPVYQTGRGGQFTYHGPGQRVAYLMLDLKRRTPDVRRFVATVEEWMIRTLAIIGVAAERRDDRVGVWVRRRGSDGDTEDKIAAIGVRVRHWAHPAWRRAQHCAGAIAFLGHCALRDFRPALRNNLARCTRH